MDTNFGGLFPRWLFVYSWIWSVSRQSRILMFLVNFVFAFTFAMGKFILLSCWGTDVIRVCSSHGEGLFDSG